MPVILLNDEQLLGCVLSVSRARVARDLGLAPDKVVVQVSAATSRGLRVAFSCELPEDATSLERKRAEEICGSTWTAMRGTLSRLQRGLVDERKAER